MRNPRGAITPFRLHDEFVVLLYYNNGHTEKVGYTGRLFYWLSVGRVKTGTSETYIEWA